MDLLPIAYLFPIALLVSDDNKEESSFKVQGSRRWLSFFSKIPKDNGKIRIFSHNTS